jgi:hypothetical protein
MGAHEVGKTTLRMLEVTLLCERKCLGQERLQVGGWRHD